ncbi:MAG TPA: hypothetical protein VGV14_10520 [Rhodanobacter sp.]|nr:hypothetical protein [Rhodanobacter sp.]
MIANDQFEWDHHKDPVIGDQSATVAYRTDWGGVAIRQRAEWDEESDSVVLLTAENAAKLAQYLIALLDKPLMAGGA